PQPSRWAAGDPGCSKRSAPGLLGRVREEPEITMRSLAGELAERGIVVNHVSVWNILRRERQPVKKKRARPRAGSARRGAPAGPLAATSMAPRSITPRLHRRDVGQDQHGAAARLVRTRQAPQGKGQRCRTATGRP